MADLDASNDDPLHDVNLSELLSIDEKASSQGYLAHLTSLPLPTLLSEPSLLQTQSHHLTSSLTSLTHTSYTTFISLHDTTSSLSSSLDSMSSSLDSLITTSLPALEECAAGWKSNTEDVLNERRKARLVLDQHDKLRDFLDIPLLIDTCTRNGYFAEALSLSAHATSMAAAWPNQTPLLVNSILSEVHDSMNQLLFSLLATLHESNRKLPALWKSVTFLRKLEAFEDDDEVSAEEQIALAFISGRETCLKATLEVGQRDIERLIGAGELAERDQEDITRYLKKYIDSWREGVYDIITQYSTIFLERQNTTTTNPKSPSLTTTATATDHLPSPRIHNLIATYASHALQVHLIPHLASTLPHIPLPSLPSLLTQLTYCATAFGRVGLDFRGLLSGLFSTAVLRAVSSELKNLTQKWVKQMHNRTGTGASTTSTKKKISLTMPSKFLITFSAISSPPLPPTTPTPNAAKAQVPPHLLASYPPLAEYTNSVLMVFNNLRLLAPLSILPDLQSHLDTALANGGRALTSYIQKVFKEAALRNTQRSRNDSDQSQEENAARAAGEAYFKSLVPFLRRALSEGVYGVKGSYEVQLDGDEGVSADFANGTLVDAVREWDGWVRSNAGATNG